MTHNNSQTQAPEIGVTVRVSSPSHLIGRSLIDGLRRSLSTRDQEELGDDFMEQARDLLQRHLHLIEFKTQRLIEDNIIDMRLIKEELENHSGHDFQRLLKARKYRRLSRKAFKIIRRASDRAVEDTLLAQIAEATRGPGVAPRGRGDGPGAGPWGEPSNNLGTATIRSNPFSDSHAISTLTDIHVDDLDEIEMSTFRTEDDSDAAAVLDLVRRDGSTQYLVATFPVDAFSGNGADRGAPTALSIHREDGTSPSLVLPHLSPGDHRNQDAETRTISSVTPTEAFQVEPSGQ